MYCIKMIGDDVETGVNAYCDVWNQERLKMVLEGFKELEIYILRSLFDNMLPLRRRQHLEKIRSCLIRLENQTASESSCLTFKLDDLYPEPEVCKSYSDLRREIPSIVTTEGLNYALKEMNRRCVIQRTQDGYKLTLFGQSIVNWYKGFKNYLLRNGRPDYLPKDQYQRLLLILP